MGNSGNKLAEGCAMLEGEERVVVGSMFRVASRKSDRIKEQDLTKIWGSHIDPRLTQFIVNFLFGFDNHKTNQVNINRFAELYIYNVRGTIDERIQLLYTSLGKPVESNSELPYQLLKEYCESLASSYVKVLRYADDVDANDWMNKGFRPKPQHVQALGEHLVSSALNVDDPSTTQADIDQQQVSKWIQRDALLKLLSGVVFKHLYRLGLKQSHSESVSDITSVNRLNYLLPKLKGIDAMPDYPAFIDVAHVVLLNSQLPIEHQHQWRFVFSSHIHGESFVTMAGRMVNQGPTLVIVQEEGGGIFGGYASRSWTISPNYAGSEDSFLFTLTPRARVYHATNYNNHFQYLNMNQKTMPNGMMMGGQLEFPGLCVRDDFVSGYSAESCSTYRGYRQLSRASQFRVRAVDIWGVGDPPVQLTDDDERQRSVLDSNQEARAILNLAGKSEYSQGIREPDPDS